MTERFALIPDVFLILKQEGKVLLLRRANTGYADGMYTVPAGHAERGEPMSAACIREAKEEAGITIEPRDLRHIVTMHRNCGDHERISFFFTTYTWGGEIKNAEPQYCDDLRWFPLADVPTNMLDYVREALGCYETGKRYMEFGFEK